MIIKILKIPLFVLIFLFFSANAYCTDVSGSVSGNWTVAGSPYIVTGDITVENGTTLTIDPGVVVKFNTGTGMTIYGLLQAIGTADNPIYFTSVNDNSVGGVTGTGNPVVGSWKDIYFDSYNNDLSSCRLEYCIIKYGGGGSAGNIHICANYYNNAKPVISSCTVSNSSNYGIYMNRSGGKSAIPTISYCTIKDNSSYAIYITCPHSSIFSGLTFSNNGYNAVGITAAAGDWRNPGYPYIVAGNIEVGNGVTLVIYPDVVVKFNSNTGLAIYGLLQAVGTASNPIYFTSVDDNSVGGATGTGNPVSGSWKDINFNSYNNDLSSCRLEYCIVKYGGGDSAGNIHICANYYYNAKPVISSCTISNSSNYGIYMNRSGGKIPIPTISYSKFINNNNQHIYNTVSGVTITAENNWWGTSPPYSGKFYDSVDYDPYLTTSADAGYFSGKVTKPDGTTPISDVSITVTKTGTTITETTTDTNGNYTIGISTGIGTVFDISASKTDYTTQTKTNQSITCGQTTTVNFTLNIAPTLSWTGETNYTSDGLDPETGYSTTTFVYRVKYTDNDNDAPKTGYPKVYIKKSGTDITGSPFTMTQVDSGDTTYSDGKLYSYSTTLSTGTDYTYYFEAYDVWDTSATGTPTSSVDAPDVTIPGADVSVNLGEALDNTALTWTTGGSANWFGQSTTYYYDNDAVESGKITHNQTTYIQTSVTGPGTLTFYWKVSSQAYDWWGGGDLLTFYIDDVEKTYISGAVDWTQLSYSISSGYHTLKWAYSKNSETNSGADCGWLDKLEWTGKSGDAGITLGANEAIVGRNLFNPTNNQSAKIKFSVPESAKVTIKIYDIMGNLVRTIIDGVDYPASTSFYDTSWDGMNDDGNIVATGLYYMYSEIGSKKTKKNIIVTK
ncbi:MAG: carboxypeptidase regulatory-like domain-containing protein [Elusimicrobiota bacterium]